MSDQSSGPSRSHLVAVVNKEDNLDNSKQSQSQSQSQSQPQSQIEQPTQKQPQIATQYVAQPQIPGDFDVLFGRGKPFQKHLGNVRMRIIFERHRKRYQSATNTDKPIIAKRVIEEIRNHHPPVRFLKRLSGAAESGDNFRSQSWYESTEEEVYKKVAHGLRAKKPVPIACKIASQMYKSPQSFLPMSFHQQDGHVTDEVAQKRARNIETGKPSNNPGMEIKGVRGDDSKPSVSFDTNMFANQRIMSSNIQNSSNTDSMLDWSGSSDDVNKLGQQHSVELFNLDLERPHCDQQETTNLALLPDINPITNPKHMQRPVGMQNNQDAGVHPTLPASIQVDSTVSIPQHSNFENTIDRTEDEMEEFRLPFARKPSTTDTTNLQIGMHRDRISQAIESMKAGEDPPKNESRDIPDA